MPWAPDVQVVYEHLHRYLWAAQLVADRDVLELASGEGFGAAILAEKARSVTGIDLDPLTVDHSSLSYGSDRVTFSQGDATDLSAFATDSFGAIVAFEMIEHVEAQARVLEEVQRVLAPGGLLLISTPDRRSYSGGNHRQNPFHVRELDRDEFTTLLEGRFAHAAIWGQRPITGSALSALGAQAAVAPAEVSATFFVESEGDEWGLAPGMSPMYLVAVASDVDLPDIARESTLADCDLGLLRSVERRAAERVAGDLRAAAEREATSADTLREAAEVRGELYRRIDDREAELNARRQRIASLTAEAERNTQTIEALSGELEVARRATAEMTQSVTWRAYRRARTRVFDLMGGTDALTVRAAQAAMRRLGRKAADRSGQAEFVPDGIELPHFSNPDVSLVIPLYSGAELTRACLESIVDNTTKVSYEVIIVDDCADGDTKALLDVVTGANILVNDQNFGYLQSVKRGAAAARGRWLVLCNNDIEVQEGWLGEMIVCGESAPEVAIVTPKYLYPDMSLNEAGGIIWRDGTGMNYGRGENPGDCRFEFRREVDYGSAAALLVRADFWHEVGGFDKRYKPMYYEDADLCFQARERGLRVMFEPRANVVHLEGGTAGTDLSTGFKRFQEVNRAKFVTRWRTRLAEQMGPGGQNARLASDRGRGTRVLIVDHRVPMWDRDAGSLRMKGMIESLIELGCRVSFLPDDRHLVLPYTLDLLRMGVEVWYGDVDVRHELSVIGSDLALVVTSRPHTSSRWLDLIRELAPAAAVVYDTVDLHWLREARRRAGRNGELVPHGSAAAALRELESGLIRACDATLVVTREEQEIIRADVPGSQVWIAPMVNPVRSPVAPLPPREGVLFIGGFEHTPNIDAAVRLVRRVMPLVWQRLGNVRVTIVGDAAPPEVRELASGQVDVAGWVQDIDPLLDRARTMVAPLTWGAGLKGKVTQSLAAGLPVVTTSIGAEGLEATDGDEMFVADDDRELAERIIRVLTEDELWTSVSDAGQDLVQRLCSPEVMRRVLAEILESASQLRAGEPRPTPVA